MKKLIMTFLIFFIFSSLLISQNKNYKGAELRTKQYFKYGRFEVRMKSVQVEGTLSTFFTYFDGTPDDPWSSTKWNEIDIEILGRYSNSAQWNVITSGSTNHVRSEITDFNPHTDFHIYGFEWTNQYIAWFIDGKEVYRQTGNHVLTVTRPQKIMMNIWLPQYPDWVGKFNPITLPAFAYYDWVSYSSYTPGAGNNGTNNNFTFQWKDEFTTEDKDRWERATHTWTGNNVNFIKENIAFQDGMMILCLTDATNIGYVDKVSPKLLWARTSAGKITAIFSEVVDKQTAESKGNYFIPGLEISSVKLLGDGRTIVLDCPSLNLNSNYNLLLQRGVKDIAVPSNDSQLQNILVIKSEPLQFPLKINVGGENYQTYIKNQIYRADSTEYGYNEGSKASTQDPISNTEEDPVYQSEINGVVKYYIRVPNGRYFVRLLFSENYFTEEGKRIFDVYAESKLIFDNFDIFKESGNKKALIKIIPTVEVHDELLELHFASEIQRTLLNGIVIDYLGPTKVENENPYDYGLSISQNFPNPFNGATNINFNLNESSQVKFKVYDFLGREVYSENLGLLNKGNNNVTWNGINFKGMNLSSGVYFYFVEGKNRSEIKKLILLN